MRFYNMPDESLMLAVNVQTTRNQMLKTGVEEEPEKQTCLAQKQDAVKAALVQKGCSERQ